MISQPAKSRLLSTTVCVVVAVARYDRSDAWYWATFL